MSSLIRKINNNIIYKILEKYKENEKGVFLKKRNFLYWHMIKNFCLGEDSYLHLENNKSKVTVDIDEKECIFEFDGKRLVLNISDSIELQIVDVNEEQFIKWYFECNFENEIFIKEMFIYKHNKRVEIKPISIIHKSTDVEIRRNDFNVYYEVNFLRFIKELHNLLYKQIKDDFSIFMINDFIKIELKEQLKFEYYCQHEDEEYDIYNISNDDDEMVDQMYFCTTGLYSNCIRIEYIEELDENRINVYLEDLSATISILNKGTSAYKNILELKNKIDKEVRQEKIQQEEEDREMRALTVQLCQYDYID